MKKLVCESLDEFSQNQEKFPMASGKEKDIIEKIVWQNEEIIGPIKDGNEVYFTFKNDMSELHTISSNHPEKNCIVGLYMVDEDPNLGVYAINAGTRVIDTPLAQMLDMGINNGGEFKKYVVSTERWKEFDELVAKMTSKGQQLTRQSQPKKVRKPRVKKPKQLSFGF